MKTCTGCFYKIKLGLNSPSENCLRYPPSVQLIMQQDKFGVQTGAVNIYPTVNDQSPACGEFRDLKVLS